MFDKDYPYTLRLEGNEGEPKRYYVSFFDGQAILYEMEIDLELFSAFRKFEKQNTHEQYIYKRYIEHSELEESTLNKRASHPHRSVEDSICDAERNKKLWSAVGELPEIQRRRFLLYYDNELTYEKIAEMEGCSHVAVIYSVEKANAAIQKNLNNFN